MEQKSRWLYGTYDMLLQPLKGQPDGPYLLSIFAKAADPESDEAWEDAPVLAQRDLALWELGGYEPPAGSVAVGEAGMAPEDMETELGPHMASCALSALLEASINDAAGVDMEGRPWRTPSGAPKAISDRILAALLSI